jgi:hypothetical protein
LRLPTPTLTPSKNGKEVELNIFWRKETRQKNLVQARAEETLKTNAKQVEL